MASIDFRAYPKSKNFLKLGNVYERNGNKEYRIIQKYHKNFNVFVGFENLNSCFGHVYLRSCICTLTKTHSLFYFSDNP